VLSEASILRKQIELPRAVRAGRAGHNGASETVDVQASKEKAQALEKKGQTAKALALYREILKNLEGSKAILRELPLYVKIGDLHAKEGDSKAALAMYDKAGRLYAEHGSGKSVIAVCGKILKVLPEGIHTHLHYARLLIEEGHVREARKVLVNYAEMFALAKVQRALAALEDRSDDEMKPMLEMVLEMAEWGEEEDEDEAQDEAPAAAAEAEGVAELEDEPQDGDEEDMEATPLDTLEPVDMTANTPPPALAQPGSDAKQSDPDEMEIAQSMTEMLEERPVQQGSRITGDIASEFEGSSEGTDEESSGDEGLILKSGEGYNIEEVPVPASDLIPDEGAPAKISDTPIPEPSPPSSATPPGEVPYIDLGPPDEPERLVTMESSQDSPIERLDVDRFSEEPEKSDFFRTPVPSSTPPPRPKSARVPTPPPRSPGAQRRVGTPYRTPARRGRRRPQPKRKSRGLAVVVFVLIFLAAVVVSVLMGLVPLGGDRTQTGNLPATDSATDGGAVVAQAFRPPPNPTPRLDRELPVRLPTLDPILDSFDVDLAALAAQLAADSTANAELGNSRGVAAPPDSLPIGTQPFDMPLIVVEGLVVERFRTLITPRRTGSRVVQVLDSGERLTLTVFPIPQQLRPHILVGQVTVTGNPDGTSEGVVRFGNYEVRGQANISTDLLEVLLGQLQLVERPNRG
jgi:hypothetical protein